MNRSLALLCIVLALVAPGAAASGADVSAGERAVRGEAAATVADLDLTGEQGVAARQALREFFAADRAWRMNQGPAAAALRRQVVRGLRLGRPAEEVDELRLQLEELEARREEIERRARVAVMEVLDGDQRRAWEEAKLWTLVLPYLAGRDVDPVQAEAIDRMLRDEATVLAKLDDSTGEPVEAAADRVLRFGDQMMWVRERQPPSVQVIVENQVRPRVFVEVERSRRVRRPRSRPETGGGGEAEPGPKPKPEEPQKPGEPESKLPPVRSAPLETAEGAADGKGD